MCTLSQAWLPVAVTDRDFFNDLHVVEDQKSCKLESTLSLSAKCIADERKLHERLSNKARMMSEIAELKRTLNEKDSGDITFRNENVVILFCSVDESCALKL